MNSLALNCSSCNAPVSLGARRCDYCGVQTPAWVVGAHPRPAPARIVVPLPPELDVYRPSPRGPVDARTLFPAVMTVFAKTVNFHSRASLAEFWWYETFHVVVTALIIFSRVPGILIWWTLLTMGPGVAVAVRRLHDVRRSGWNYLWVFTGVGAFVVLYWMMLPSDSSPGNRWGPPRPL